MVNRVGALAVAVLMTGAVVDAQFKTKPETTPRSSGTESLVRSDDSGLMFGWFDPSRLTMHQSYSLSYASFGGKGISLGEYTNSMLYRISDPLSVQLDISLMHSPYNSFGDRFGKDLSGLRISRAQINYRPAENMLFQLQFRQVPVSSLYLGYPSSSGFYGLDRMDESRP